jgi:hypothetical protein
MTVKNNIFLNHASTSSNTGWYELCSDGGGSTADYNYVANLDFTQKTGFSETHGVNGGNPHISNLGGTAAIDYSLTSSSTLLINAGVDLSTIFTTDYAGNTRTGTWDIGAYEYNTVFGTVTGITISPGVAFK